MMSGDCQSQGLAEWLQALGCSENLQPSDLRKLNTPKMRSVWRHLQAHVVPTHVASTIRKNVLLARLEEENIFVGQFQNFKLDSVNQLYKVKEILKVEEEKDRIKDEIKMIDNKLKSEKSSLLQKIAIEEWEMQKLSETEDKTMLLELKHGKLSKDYKKVIVNNETAVHLKSSKTPISHSELNHQKSLVSKYVKNYRYPFKDTEDDSEYLCEMMGSILEFKPDSILDGITQNAKEAVRSLNPKVESSAIIGDNFSSNKKAAFQEKLRDLKILIIRKELKICEYGEMITIESNDLHEEKSQLVEAFSKKGENNSNFEKQSGLNELEKGKTHNGYKETVDEVVEVDKNKVGTNKYVHQLLNNVLEKIQEERKNNKIRRESRLMPDDELETLEDLEQLVSSLTAEGDKLWGEVEKKVNEVNMVASAVYGSLVDSGELNELLAEISSLTLDFKTEISQICKNNNDSNVLTEMIFKEIEVFQKTPLAALQRNRNTSIETLRVCLAEKFLSNPSLLNFLLLAEEKNSIVNVLEKYLWSVSINPQFH